MQRIYFGAPGTGKSYLIDTKILNGVADEYIFRTTFYNDYTYYDFIGQLMPKIVPSSQPGVQSIITYDFNKGIFTQALEKAYEDLSKDVYLILEEMSRGDSAAIFGDIFQLLDRENRGMNKGFSRYFINNDIISKDIIALPSTKIKLPPNLHILGTVNTSDQNVNVLDTAFKRRFEFVYVDVFPKYELINEGLPDKHTNRSYYNSYTFQLGTEQFEWNKFYMAINRFIVDKLKLSEDKQLGQFFVQFDSQDVSENFELFKNKVLHYLWEDVQGVSYTGESIFYTDDTTRSINSFSKLYNTFLPETDAASIFSDDFIKYYRDLDL